jgi:hypothetical protein
MLPISFTVLAIFPVSISALKSLATIAITLGGLFLLSQLARDRGKSKEEKLFEGWGGIPSTLIFRHSDKRLDSITKVRYHKRLAVLVTGTKSIGVVEESSNLSKADNVYSAWASYLRSATRDTKKYSLLFQENINYGYRRNVWGLRIFGICSCGLCIFITAVIFYQRYKISGSIDFNLAGAFMGSVVFVLLWIFRFNREWVRITAFAYAERLAESVETL